MSVRYCKFETCDREARARGYCAGHYLQKAKGKELTPLAPRNFVEDGRKVCTKCGTEKPVEDYYQRQNTTAIFSRCKECTREDRRNRTKEKQNR